MIQALLKLRLITIYDFLELDTYRLLEDVISIDSELSEDYSIFYTFDNIPID